MSGSYLLLQPPSPSPSPSDSTAPVCFYPLLRNIWTDNVFNGLCLAPRPTPTWRTSTSLFFWVIICDLSGTEGFTNNYVTPSTATRIIWSRQPHHYIKVGIPVATVPPAPLSELFVQPSPTSKSNCEYFQWVVRA